MLQRMATHTLHSGALTDRAKGESDIAADFFCHVFQSLPAGSCIMAADSRLARPPCTR